MIKPEASCNLCLNKGKLKCNICKQIILYEIAARFIKVKPVDTTL